MPMHEFKEFRKPVTVIRKADGEYTDGHWVAGASETTFLIEGDVQPLASGDFDKLPSGRRIDDSLTLYSNTRLYDIDDRAENPDIFIHDGKRYEVVRTQKWQGDIISHYKMIGSKVDEAQNL